MIKQNKLLKIKNKLLSNLFNEKYGLKLGEFNNTVLGLKVSSMRFRSEVNSLAHSLGCKLLIG